MDVDFSETHTITVRPAQRGCGVTDAAQGYNANFGGHESPVTTYICASLEHSLDGGLVVRGCGEEGDLSIPSALVLHITNAQVTRITRFPTNHTPAFAGVSVNPAAAQRLYAALLALPMSPPQQMLGPCHADVGIAYRIRIYSGTTLQLQAWAKPDGCEQVKIGTSAVLHGSDSQFWQTLANTLGVPESALFDLTSRHTGPFAKPADPSDWTTP